jgi:hypothetical protein
VARPGIQAWGPAGLGAARGVWRVACGAVWCGVVWGSIGGRGGVLGAEHMGCFLFGVCYFGSHEPRHTTSKKAVHAQCPVPCAACRSSTGAIATAGSENTRRDRDRSQAPMDMDLRANWTARCLYLVDATATASGISFCSK